VQYQKGLTLVQKLKIRSFTQKKIDGDIGNSARASSSLEDALSLRLSRKEALSLSFAVALETGTVLLKKPSGTFQLLLIDGIQVRQLVNPSLVRSLILVWTDLLSDEFVPFLQQNQGFLLTIFRFTDSLEVIRSPIGGDLLTLAVSEIVAMKAHDHNLTGFALDCIYQNFHFLISVGC